MIEERWIKALQGEAEAAMKRASAPYSKFRVGAALLTDDDQIISGCNIENASYGATLCAERAALARLLSASDAQHGIRAVYVTNETDTKITPCGICRQTLYEFNPEMIVFCANQRGDYDTHRLDALLPFAFTLEQDAEK